MKSLITLFLLLWCSVIGMTQHIYSDTTWERWYGKQYYNESALGVNYDIEHYDRGYIFHSDNERYTEPNKPVLKKTDVNGYYLWERKLDSTINKISRFVKNYSDGGILIGGASYHSDIGPNPWAAKLNACMEVEWCHIFEWPSTSSAVDIAEDNEGNILVLTSALGEWYNEMINIVKLTPDGEIIWKEDFATLDDYPEIWSAFPYQILIAKDNSIYIAAKADWPDGNDPNWSGTRSLFIKVTTDGQEEWVLPFGIYDELYSRPKSLHQYGEDTFVALGDNYETLNPVIMFFNSEGEELSFTSKIIMPDVYYYNGFPNAVLINDSTFISDWRYTYSIDEIFTHTGYMIFDTALNVIQYLEDDRWTGACSVIKTFNDRYVFISSMKENNNSGEYDIYLNKRNLDFTYDTVYTNWSGNYDTLCPHAIESGYLPYECEPTIVGMQEWSEKETNGALLVKIIPNPANDKVRVVFENAQYEDLELLLFTLDGTEIFTKRLSYYPQSTEIDVSHLAKGAYMIIVKNNKQIIGRNKLMVE
jgi:hypothetical protein